MARRAACEIEELQPTRLPLQVYFGAGAGDESLETRIIPERIEHWIEPEQRGSQRHV